MDALRRFNADACAASAARGAGFATGLTSRWESQGGTVTWHVEPKRIRLARTVADMRRPAEFRLAVDLVR